MRILETDFHLDWGGQAAVVLLLSKVFAARGHEVTVAAPPGSELARRAAAAGLEVFTGARFRNGFRPLSFLRDARALAGLLRARGGDILHVHGSQDTWICAAANRLAGAPARLVRTKHNNRPIRAHAANRWLYGRLASACTAVSRESASLLAPLVRADRLAVIHAPIEDRFWRTPPPPLDLRRELGLPPETPLVAHVARLCRLKGQDVVLDCAPLLAARVPGVRLLLIGTGEEYHRLLARIGQLRLQDTVLLLGFRDDVPSVVAACDAAILPSVEPEGSPVALKEAMSLARPAVATALGGNVEIIEDGVCGLLIPPSDPAALADALARLLLDRPLAARLGEAARRTVLARFTADAVAEEYLRVFASFDNRGQT